MGFKEQAKELELIVPSHFWQTDEDYMASRGCGPGKGLGDWFVPDTMWGLNIKLPCIIHDLEWALAVSIEDIKKANMHFLINLLKVINAKSGFLFKQLRRYRAVTYYTAVEDIGTIKWADGSLR